MKINIFCMFIIFMILFISFITIYNFMDTQKESFTPEIREVINSNTRRVKNIIISGFEPLNKILKKFNIS